MSRVGLLSSALPECHLRWSRIGTTCRTFWICLAGPEPACSLPSCSIFGREARGGQYQCVVGIELFMHPTVDR